MTPDDFRRIALSFEGAEEGSHMGAVDFRVGGRVFATLASVKEGYGNLMISPEIQADFLADRPDLFLPIKGGWGRMGMTHIRLSEATEDVLTGALHAAWKLRVANNSKTRSKASSKTALKSTTTKRMPRKSSR
ncbi:MAG: MmcQ/YjbR family DNA-binding protein [Bryobacterales bacterium]|nr:MmcQ/YjbR family DNA-binding protein [Bryobacterales bacterium]